MCAHASVQDMHAYTVMCVVYSLLFAALIFFFSEYAHMLSQLRRCTDV